ncbi:hypothetical protein phiGM223_21 [Pseudomonas phage phiGM22-3]|uniref:Uncharacterized protein n=1 Tax=Pseudomonas phage phiGM22-3 TaxID=2816462 RepID=A0A8T8IV28_9CAUD|nr:hypothetical protein phiGM223_21 [Pseudomonas phage phiGM22-3]
MTQPIDALHDLIRTINHCRPADRQIPARYDRETLVEYIQRVDAHLMGERFFDRRRHKYV